MESCNGDTVGIEDEYATMKYLFYTLFIYALLVSLAYMANVAIGIFSGQGSLYSSLTIIIFIFSCISICFSIFLGMKIKILSSIVFFICLIVTSYNDLVVNAIFHSDNEGRELFINMAFFLFGYILPAVGIVVGARLLILSQYDKAARTSKRTGASR